MIQIPIENAIKHALKDKEGMKRLWIDIKKTGEGICVKVRDNGGGYRINSACLLYTSGKKERFSRRNLWKWLDEDFHPWTGNLYRSYRYFVSTSDPIK